MVYHVYILESEATGRYYIGQTQDLDGRLACHNAGYSRYTRNRGPWKLVHSESFPTRSDALKREYLLKRHKDRRMIQRLLSASRS